MRHSAKARIGGLISAAMALSALALVGASSTSAATTTPPWEPDTEATGTLSLYDASGNPVTSGTIDTPLAVYAVGSATVRAGDIQGAIFGASPNPTATSTAPGSWSQEQWTAFTKYPLTTGPANIQTLSQTHPIAVIGASDENLSGLIADFSNDSAHDSNTSYQNLYQIRLVTANAAGQFQAKVYDDLDVLVNGNTWTQVYPAPAAGPVTTTTSLQVTPSSPQTAGTSVTLTATLAPTNAVGSVQFKDGSTNLGAAKPVNGGTASISTTSLAAGTHSLTAVFTPTDSTAFTTSTSAAVSYVINTPAATPTTTTLDVTPASPVTVGTTSTLTATVGPSDAAGTVQFMDGATAIGTPKAVTSGTATTTATFTVNTHSLTAVFTPTDTTAFSGSTSSAVSYVVNPEPATPTTTSLAASVGSPQTYGDPLALTATVTPTNAVGSVQFLDGTTVIDTQPVASGSASSSPTTLSAGTHSLTAKFVPTNPATFGASQSDPQSVNISAASTTTSMSVSPASPQQQGTTLTLSATLTPAAATGTVQFFDGTTAVGSPAPVTAGAASTTYSNLAVGDHSLKATFTPANGNYTTSTSSPATPFTITKPPPGTTTTGLSVSPNGTAGHGATETLTATITPSAAAGTVQFLDGTTPINSPVTVSGGNASTTTTLADGTHSLSAAFTSADPTTFSDSTSSTVSYVVKPPAATTTTTLTASPSGSAGFGSAVTLQAAVSPSTAAGTVQFLDGSAAVGAPVAVSSGNASKSTSTLAGGAHSLTAVFTPASPLDFQPSTSSAVSFTVDAAATTTSLGVSPAGPINAGTKETLTASVSPSAAAGSVTFADGSTTVGSAPVSGGKASIATTALPVGTVHLTAAFTPSVAADYSASTSAEVTMSVVQPATIGTVSSGGTTIGSNGTVAPGSTLTITASGFTPNATVTITLHSSPVTLGTTKASSTGTVTAVVTLPLNTPAGTHTIVFSDGQHTASRTIVVAKHTTSGGGGTQPNADPGSGGGLLATTGFDTVGTLTLGLVLVVAGFALTTRRRPRRVPGQHRYLD